MGSRSVASGTAFDLTAFLIENGMSFTYTISPDMLEQKLEDGNYRIVTDVWYPTDRIPIVGGELPQESPAFYNTEKHTVWADFTIDINAPIQRAYEFHYPSGLPIKMYRLSYYVDICQMVDSNPLVAITYFQPDREKEGGAYVKVFGKVKKIDEYERVIVMTNGIKVKIDDVFNIGSELFKDLM